MKGQYREIFLHHSILKGREEEKCSYFYFGKIWAFLSKSESIMSASLLKTKKGIFLGLLEQDVTAYPITTNNHLWNEIKKDEFHGISS